MILHKKNDKKEKPRTIWQYHYKGWPDHGVPRSPSEMLEFWVLVTTQLNALRAEFKENLGPIVVHCSAGIGRTGTFIVVHIIQQVIAARGKEAEIDIQATIQRVRGQRSGMIQTEVRHSPLHLVNYPLVSSSLHLLPPIVLFLVARCLFLAACLYHLGRIVRAADRGSGIWAHTFVWDVELHGLLLAVRSTHCGHTGLLLYGLARCFAHSARFNPFAIAFFRPSTSLYTTLLHTTLTLSTRTR